MPDVRLPDGTIVKNVPEGMTQAALLTKLAANGVNVPKEWYPAPPVEKSGSDLVHTLLNRAAGGALDVAGLPMTTLNNAANLVKAAVGTPYTAITGDAPSALQPVENEDMPGTGEWLKKKFAEHGVSTSSVDNRDPAQRYGGAVAEALPSLVMGKPLTAGELALQTAGTVGGSLAQQGAADKGAGPTGQILAGIAGGAAPGAVIAAPAMAARAALGRGGSPDTAALAGLREAEGAGISNPRYGQVSGRSMPTTLEAFLTKFPTSAGIMAKNASQQAQQASDSINAITDQLMSRAPSSRQAGLAIDRGITDSFMDRTGKVRGKLYDRLDSLIPGDSKVDITPYQDQLASLTAPIKGARAQSAVIQDETNGSFMTTLNAALKRDLKLANLPEGAQPHTMAAADYWTDGQQSLSSADAAKAGMDFSKVPGWRRVQRDETPGWIVPTENGPRFLAEKDLEPGTELPYQAVKELRTQVGAMLNQSLLNNKSDANLSRLYGSLTKVMQQAAEDAGPQAKYAFDRANSYYSALQTRLKTLQRIVDNNGGPEGIYNAAMSGTKDGASTLHKVMQSLPEESRNVVIANVLQKLGKAIPSKQNAASDVWSYSTFLTNYNRMSPAARAELFGRLPADYKTSLDSLAKFSEKYRNADSMYANPSGTAHTGTMIGTVATGATVAGEALLHHDVVPAGIFITGLVGANLGARAMTNPRFVKWLANSYRMPVSATPALISQLAQQAKAEGDPTSAGIADALVKAYQQHKAQGATNQFMQQQAQLEQEAAAQAADKEQP